MSSGTDLDDGVVDAATSFSALDVVLSWGCTVRGYDPEPIESEN